MRNVKTWFVALLLASSPVHAQDVRPRPAQDIWNAAYLAGGKAGFVHTSVQTIERGGQRLRRVTTELNLTIKRGNNMMQMRMETGDEETADGKVTTVFMRQYQGDRVQ